MARDILPLAMFYIIIVHYLVPELYFCEQIIYHGAQITERYSNVLSFCASHILQFIVLSEISLSENWNFLDFFWQGGGVRPTYSKRGLS